MLGVPLVFELCLVRELCVVRIPCLDKKFPCQICLVGTAWRMPRQVVMTRLGSPPSGRCRVDAWWGPFIGDAPALPSVTHQGF
jgi:hypothetical protein